MNDNKLIAEFMGIDTKGMCYYIPEHEKPSNHYEGMTSTFFPDELEYHSSWDWLMPVVEKIMNMDTSQQRIFVTISGGEVNITVGKLSIYQDNFDSITNVYEAVVQFIKWYNKQEKGK